METAARGRSVPLDALAEPQSPREAGDDGQIVIVRPQVVENIGHVLGNLFQRIYHLIGQTTGADAVVTGQLDSCTRQLEDFLQLVMDYFSPLSMTLQYVSGTEVAQSLARQLSETIGCAVKIDLKLLVEGRLLVDPGRLARGFGLLASQLRPSSVDNERIELNVIARPPGRTLTFNVVIPSCFVMARSSLLEMRWAVAEKFLELHGGALEPKSTPSGGVLWEIVLPLQP